MKTRFTLAFLILFSTFLSGCFLNQELPLEYDYSYKGRFEKYKSYAFLDSQEETQQDNLIKNSIISHMSFLGYKLKYNNPDLLISYTMFKDSLNLVTYNQQDINQWLDGFTPTNLEYDSKRMPMQSGTLYLQIMDRKQKSSIWQGYVTKEYGYIDFSNSRNVRNAVRSVLNEYQFFADGFMEQRVQNVN